jgi:ferrous iron transport protein A
VILQRFLLERFSQYDRLHVLRPYNFMMPTTGYRDKESLKLKRRCKKMAIEFAELKVGDHATITQCELLTGSQGQRLMMLGLTPGTSLKVVRVAPLGDPIEIKIRGFNLSLRREEARGIWVDKI